MYSKNKNKKPKLYIPRHSAKLVGKNIPIELENFGLLPESGGPIVYTNNVKEIYYTAQVSTRLIIFLEKLFAPLPSILPNVCLFLTFS